MHNLVISYDLYKQGQNYDALVAEIKKLGGWAKINLSVWYVDSAFTAQQAVDRLWRVMDTNDKIFVVDAVDNAAAWQGVSKDASDYIQGHWNSRK